MANPTGSLSNLHSTRDPFISKSVTLASRPAMSLHSLSRRSPNSSSQDMRGHSLVSITHGHGVEVPPLQTSKITTKVEESEDEDESSNRNLHPVPTDFCDWCGKYFANSLTKVSFSVLQTGTCLLDNNCQCAHCVVPFGLDLCVGITSLPFMQNLHYSSRRTLTLPVQAIRLVSTASSETTSPEKKQ